MANEPIITIVGNIGSEPELRFTPSGAAVCNFSVAVTARRKDSEGNWTDGDVTWYRVNAWRQMAENIAESLVKGTRVVVQGRLENRPWENREGVKGLSLEITADACGPDLTWATARVQRPERTQSGGGQQGGGNWDNQPQGGGQRRQQGNQGGQYDNRGGQQGSFGGNPADDPWGSAPAGRPNSGFADEPPF